MARSKFLLAVLFALTTIPALAHPGIGSITGFTAGFNHPMGGLDHILAMVAVGILAAQLGGRALWIVPGSFVGLMIVGGILGATGGYVPFVEQGIVGSVIVLGAVVAIGRRLPLTLAVSLVGVLGIFHGHAHGTEMPANAIGLLYGAGFLAATILLHVAGIALGMGAKKASDALAPAAVRIGGAAIAAAGLVLGLT